MFLCEMSKKNRISFTNHNYDTKIMYENPLHVVIRKHYFKLLYTCANVWCSGRNRLFLVLITSPKSQAVGYHQYYTKVLIPLNSI